MSVQIIRGEEFLQWLAEQGGTTTATNPEIAAAIGARVGTSRMSEAINDLADTGAIRIERVKPHRKHAPSGRVIHINEAF